MSAFTRVAVADDHRGGSSDDDPTTVAIYR